MENQIMQMLQQAESDPQQLARLAASNINPQQLVAKLRAVGTRFAPTPAGQSGIGAALGGAPEINAPQGGGIGELLP